LQGRDHFARGTPNRGERFVFRVRLRAPRGRTGIAVERIRIALAERKNEPDVGFGIRVDPRTVVARA
jgi:hypothetical protein